MDDWYKRRGAAWYRAWRRTPSGKASVSRYNRSDKGKARQKRWQKTANGRALERKYEARNRIKLRLIVEAAKNKPCVDCGGVFESACLDFHHIIGKKESEISRLVGRGCTFARLHRELAKCVLLCSNCHRLRHHKLKLSRLR